MNKQWLLKMRAWEAHEHWEDWVISWLDYLCCILIRWAFNRLIVLVFGMCMCVWFALIRRTKHNKHSICGWESMLFVYLSIRATNELISAAANAICGRSLKLLHFLSLELLLLSSFLFLTAVGNQLLVHYRPLLLRSVNQTIGLQSSFQIKRNQWNKRK